MEDEKLIQDGNASKRELSNITLNPVQNKKTFFD